MTEYGRKALEMIGPGGIYEVNVENMSALITALKAAIEQHEAFRQEVSDAVVDYVGYVPSDGPVHPITRFIITKPDPLVDAIKEASQMAYLGDEHLAHNYRAAIEKRGGKIVWEQDQ